MIRLAIGALALALAFSPGAGGRAATARASASPAWLSFEYPPNPYDPATRDAVVLVHAFHFNASGAMPLRGTAEGLVNGVRRSVPLEFAPMSRPGDYALRRQWGADGVWTLVIGVNPGAGAAFVAQAAVDVDTDGQVTAVRVPTRRQGQWPMAAGVIMADVEAGLRARAAAHASR